MEMSIKFDPFYIATTVGTRSSDPFYIVKDLEFMTYLFNVFIYVSDHNVLVVTGPQPVEPDIYQHYAGLQHAGLHQARYP